MYTYKKYNESYLDYLMNRYDAAPTWKKLLLLPVIMIVGLLVFGLLLGGGIFLKFIFDALAGRYYS